MPDMSGFELTRIITRDEATKHIPVILCTSKSHETDRLWGLRQGATNYVVKPVDESDLLAKITALAESAIGGTPRPAVLQNMTRCRFRPTCSAADTLVSAARGHCRARSWRSFPHGT